MTEFGETLIAEAQDAAAPAAEPAPEFENPRLAGRLRILDPTVAFGEEAKLPIASLAVYEQPDSTLTKQTLRGLNRAVGTSLEVLRSAERHVPQPVGAQTDPSNPLALTEHEAAVVARWQTQDEARQEEATDTTGFLGVPLARLAIGTAATGLVSVGGGLVVATPALGQQPNQISAPAAKIAQPFEFGLTDALDDQALDSVPDTATSLTPEEEQECVKIATSIIPNRNNGFVMHHPGIRPRTGHGGIGQIIRGGYYTESLPDGSEPGEPDCASSIQRWQEEYSEIQSAHHPGKWLNGYWGKYHPKAFPAPTPQRSPSQVVTSLGSLGELGTMSPPFLYNQCPDGKHWLKVRVRDTLSARDVQDGQDLGSHSYTWLVKIGRGSCAAAARSERINAHNLGR